MKIPYEHKLRQKLGRLTNDHAANLVVTGAGAVL